MEKSIEVLANEKVIGIRKYQALKTYDFEKMSAEDMVQFREERKMSVADAEKEIERYEAKYRLTPEQIELKKEYFNKLISKENTQGKKISAEQLFKLFIKQYVKIYNKEYKVEKESSSLENLKTLLFYFTKDERFFNQKNLIKNIDFNGVKKTSKPSFEKGFILIGGNGTGKTSSMNVFDMVFKNLYKNGFDVPFFNSETTQNLVDVFEGCEKSLDKKEFWRKVLNGRYFFDDLKAEGKSSNYGTKNIMQEVIEKRENKIDFVSMNFDYSRPKDIPASLIELASKYGNRVFDRIFSKWNIIIFDDNSYRGK